MKMLMAFALIYSASAFAQRAFIYPSFMPSRLSQDARKIVEENPCLGGGERLMYGISIDSREARPGTEFIGVTSYGDVVSLKNNNLLEFYYCPRGSGAMIGNITSSINLEDPGVNCSVGEILSLTVQGPASYNFYFRSPRFSDNASLCHNHPTAAASSVERQIRKDEYGFIDGEPIRSQRVYSY